MQKIQKILLVFLEKNSREADKRTESISLDFHFVSRTQKLTRNKGNKQKKRTMWYKSWRIYYFLCDPPTGLTWNYTYQNITAFIFDIDMNS